MQVHFGAKATVCNCVVNTAGKAKIHMYHPVGARTSIHVICTFDAVERGIKSTGNIAASAQNRRYYSYLQLRLDAA